MLRCNQRGVLEQSGAPGFDEYLKSHSLFPSSGKASASSAKVHCLQVSAVQVRTLLGTTRRRTAVYTLDSSFAVCSFTSIQAPH